MGVASPAVNGGGIVESNSGNCEGRAIAAVNGTPAVGVGNGPGKGDHLPSGQAGVSCGFVSVAPVAAFEA